MYNFSRATRFVGNDLLRYVCNFLILNPKHWNQQQYQCDPKAHLCGTAFCFGGWAAMIKTNDYDEFKKLTLDEIIDLAEKSLGLCHHDGRYLFDTVRTMPEIRHFVMTKMLGYNSDGYDRDGILSSGRNDDGSTRLSKDIKLDKKDKDLEVIP